MNNISVRTILQAIAAFFQIREDTAAIGALNYPKEVRQKLALQSQKWSCQICGPIKNTIMQKVEKIKGANEPIELEKKAAESTTIIKDEKENKCKDEPDDIEGSKSLDDLNKDQNSSPSTKQIASKKPTKFKKSDKNTMYLNIKSTILEDNEEYDEEAKAGANPRKDFSLSK
jgi:hypothetical protein